MLNGIQEYSRPTTVGMGVKPRNVMITTPSLQNLLKTRGDKLQQTMQEKQFKNLYDKVVAKQLNSEGQDLNAIELQTVAVKYLGIADGKLGILSRKVPM